MVENAIFPALCLRGQDAELWEEDGEEYLLRNLPSQAVRPNAALIFRFAKSHQWMRCVQNPIM